jgi:RNA polymerase sigma factor (sigma-70 family)
MIDIVGAENGVPCQSTGRLPRGSPQTRNSKVSKSVTSGVRVGDAMVIAARMDERVQNALLERVWPVIQQAARAKLRPGHDNLEDMEQEGWVVFVGAIQKYDGRSPGSFVRYLQYELHTALRQYQARDRLIAVPHDTRTQAVQWSKVARRTQAARMAAQNLVSLEDALHVQNEDNTMETAAGNEINKRFNKLPEAWKAIVRALYRDGRSLADTAILMGMPASEIREIEMHIMNACQLPVGVFKTCRTEEDFVRAVTERRAAP